MTVPIPLRFVETLSSSAAVALHPEGHIQAAVARANEIWNSAGVEFWVKSIERYSMPNLHRYVRDKDPDGCPNGTYCFAWAAVRDELRQVFPACRRTRIRKSITNQPGTGSMPRRLSTNEILVWLVDEDGGDGGSSEPWTGRMVYLRRDALWEEGIGATTQLAHEIGHFLGPAHNNDSFLPEGYDHCDRWDQARARCALPSWRLSVFR